MMVRLADGAGYVDVNFRDVPGVIAAGVLIDSDGVTLVDPGPTSCLNTLRRDLAAHGIGTADITRILLTHVHLDHAGATGTLLREHPEIEVYVHERGARHLTDPAKLIDSASRVFGPTMMDTLWGAILPVPGARVRVLRGGERLRIGGREIAVAYTPGHASHHVSYFDAVDGIAWVGDTAGVRVGRSAFIMPPTPPPDINLELWDTSLAEIGGWGARLLFRTHGGPAEQVQEQVESLRRALPEIAEMVRRSLSAGADPDVQFAAFGETFREYARGFLLEADAAAYETVSPLRYNWNGLERYWMKHAAAANA